MSDTSQVFVAAASNQIFELNPAGQVVAVINAGPQGPPGTDATVATYTHTQLVADTSWVINHNLGFYPNVTAFDDLGRVIEPAEIHHTVNQLELQLLTPRSGLARLS